MRFEHCTVHRTSRIVTYFWRTINTTPTTPPYFDWASRNKLDGG